VQPRFHQLSEPVLRALCSTTEDEAAVAALLDVEHSRRLLLMRAALDLGAEVPEAGAEDVQEAWRLLEAAQKLDPEAFRAVLRDPQVGLWVVALFRRLSRDDRAPAEGEAPLAAELGFLGQLAAAANIAAGADFQLRVPVRDGRVLLPGLGRALIGDVSGDSAESVEVAEVWARDGVVRIAGGGTTVTLPGDPETDAPGWEGLRRLRAAHDGESLTLVLDDLGTYPAVPGLATAGRLTEDGFADWQSWITAMWRVLVDDHPDRARALSAGLLSVVPLPRGERLRARAASSSDAFGCVLLSEPDEDELPAQLGVALVHEFRHTLLNGLIFLEPLFEECGELFHAPWRDDPRGLGGLVHGAYAFSGVARYWRTRGTEGLAGFEFALWRDAVREALTTLRHHPALTPLGHQLVAALTEQTAPWRAEPVGGRELRLARLSATHHHATWRAHHLRTDPAHAERLARAWEAGERTPRRATSTPAPAPALHTDPQACRLDALALLSRLSIIDPDAFTRLRREPDPGNEIPGVTAADLALIEGDPETAVKLYAEELATSDARPAAWAGLGLALTESGERGAGEWLTAHPELAVALSSKLPTLPDPLALASWLAAT
jgi:HEXXH motif-containing protein